MAKGDTRAAMLAYDDAVRLCKGIDRAKWLEPKNKRYRLKKASYEEFFKGWHHYRKKEWRDAIRVWDALLRRYPRGEYAESALFHKAGAYTQIGNRRTAAQTYKSFIATFPNANSLPWACVEISEYYLYEKKTPREALKWLRSAVQAAPDGYNSDVCQYLIATTYWEFLGNYKQSYVELKKFLKLYPNSDLRTRVELRVEYIERYGLKNVDGSKSQKGTRKARKRK